MIIAVTISVVLFMFFALAIVREAWLGYPPPPFSASVLTRKEQAFLRASAETFFPSGGALPSGIEAHVVESFDQFLVVAPGRQRFLIRCLFVLIEHGAIVFGPFHRRFTRQTAEQRLATLRDWEQSPFYFRRMSILSLRTLLTLAYFQNPRVSERCTPTVC